LAILVWHFYQVFFDPYVCPMNGAWWDGKMTLHHDQNEHGLDTSMIAETEDEPSGVEPAAREEQELEPTGANHGH
jgi:hypothetical protein